MNYSKLKTKFKACEITSCSFTDTSRMPLAWLFKIVCRKKNISEHLVFGSEELIETPTSIWSKQQEDNADAKDLLLIRKKHKNGFNCTEHHEKLGKTKRLTNTIPIFSKSEKHSIVFCKLGISSILFILYDKNRYLGYRDYYDYKSLVFVMNYDLFGKELSENNSPKHKRKYYPHENVRRTLFDYFNLDIYSTLQTVGKEQMPVITPVNTDIYLPKEMIAFDEAYTKKETDCIVHFFTDDRRFLRIFRNPKKYLPFLRKCAAVIEPDLSQYANMPYALRQAHAWLNRALAAWLQSNGVQIIQNITWSLKDSYGYSLAGRAKNTIVAVNCTGILKHDISKYLWREGYKNVVLELNPTKILRYGDRMLGEKTEISVYFENSNLKRLRHGW